MLYAVVAMWAVYPEEKRAAEQPGADLIHKICTRTARIIVGSSWIATKAVWLVPGRPGYMVYKEDSTGKPETWKDPYCILCASYATQDHIGTDKHIGNVVAATNSAILKGWGQILAWLQQDVREVIEVTGHTPVDRASNNSGSSDDAALYLNLTRAIEIHASRASSSKAGLSVTWKWMFLPRRSQKSGCAWTRTWR